MPASFAAEPDPSPGCEWIDLAAISPDRLEWARVRALRETETQLLLCSEDLAASASVQIVGNTPADSTEVQIGYVHEPGPSLTRKHSVANIARSKCNVANGGRDVDKCEVPAFNGGAIGKYAEPPRAGVDRVPQTSYCYSTLLGWRQQGEMGVCAESCTRAADCRRGLETCQNGVCVEPCTADYGARQPKHGNKLKACSHPANPFCKWNVRLSGIRTSYDGGHCVSNVDIARHGRLHTPPGITGLVGPAAGDLRDLWGTISYECPPGQVATGLVVTSSKTCLEDKDKNPDVVDCGKPGKIEEFSPWLRNIQGLQCQRVQEAADPANPGDTILYAGVTPDGGIGITAVGDPRELQNLGSTDGGGDHNRRKDEILSCPKGYALTGANIPGGPWVTGFQGYCRKLLEPGSEPVTTQPSHSTTAATATAYDNTAHSNAISTASSWKGNTGARHDGQWLTGISFSWKGGPRNGIRKLGLHISTKAQTDRTIDDIVAEDVTIHHDNPACSAKTTEYEKILNEGAKIGLVECRNRAAKRCCNDENKMRCARAVDNSAYTLLDSAECTHDGVDDVEIATYTVQGGLTQAGLETRVDQCQEKCNEAPECAGFSLKYNDCKLLKHVAGAKENLHGRSTKASRCYRRNTQATDDHCACYRNNDWTSKAADQEVMLPHKCSNACGGNPKAFDPTSDSVCAIEQFCAIITNLEADENVRHEDNDYRLRCGTGTGTGTGDSGTGDSGSRSVITGDSGTGTGDSGSRSNITGGSGTGDSGTGTGDSGSRSDITGGSGSSSEDDDDDEDNTLTIVIAVIVAVVLLGVGYVYCNNRSGNFDVGQGPPTVVQSPAQAEGQ